MTLRFLILHSNLGGRFEVPRMAVQCKFRRSTLHGHHAQVFLDVVSVTTLTSGDRSIVDILMPVVVSLCHVNPVTPNLCLSRWGRRSFTPPFFPVRDSRSKNLVSFPSGIKCVRPGRPTCRESPHARSASVFVFFRQRGPARGCFSLFPRMRGSGLKEPGVFLHISLLPMRFDCGRRLLFRRAVRDWNLETAFPLFFRITSRVPVLAVKILAVGTHVSPCVLQASFVAPAHIRNSYAAFYLTSSCASG